MNTLQNSKTNVTDSKQTLANQHEIVKAFFQTDSASEMIESLHMMVESFLFSDDLENVSPAMRVHVVNQLRVASLIAKLREDCLPG